ncbi:MAG: hypothetical protein ACLU4J_25350 [Butyricimonas paravirosa]
MDKNSISSRKHILTSMTNDNYWPHRGILREDGFSSITTAGSAQKPLSPATPPSDLAILT